MQITFDPLDMTEVQSIQACLAVLHALKPMTPIKQADAAILNAQHAKPGSPIIDSTLLNPADDPSVGADPPPTEPLSGEQLRAAYGESPSAIPLPPVPAPSTAAATLFPTAPAAPQASVPPAPPVPSPPVPAAPPPAPAPTANAAPAPPVGDVDSTGLPWDERIHASTKTMNADGTWRQRRGLNDPGLVKRVEAELRASAPSAGPLTVAPPVAALESSSSTTGAVPANVSTVTAPAASVVPSAPIAATAVVPPPPVTPVTLVAVPAPPVPAGASSVTMTAEVAAVVGSIGAPSDFGNTMNIVTKLIAAGLVKEEGVNAVLLSVGLNPNQIGVLAGDPAKTQQVADALRALAGA